MFSWYFLVFDLLLWTLMKVIYIFNKISINTIYLSAYKRKNLIEEDTTTWIFYSKEYEYNNHIHKGNSFHHVIPSEKLQTDRQ